MVFPTRSSSLPASSSRSTSPVYSLSSNVAQLSSDSQALQPSSHQSLRNSSPQRLSLIINKPFNTKKKMIKRFSSLPPGTPLDLPCSTPDWKKTISEIKRLHSTQRFRLCSAKCCEIIESIKSNNSHIEPTYMIYLHFYAASSLETSALPIPVTSELRVKLLEKARSHYSDAASLIQAAEDSAVASSRSSSALSARFSVRSNSCGSITTPAFSRQHSPTGSFSSRAPTPAADVSSPGCSASSMFVPPGPPPPMAAPSPPIKKKVSFYMPVPDEPMVRPDSPTLGFDDLEVIENASRDLPALPPQPTRLSILKPLRSPVGTTHYGPRTLSISSIASSSISTAAGSHATSSPSSDTSIFSSGHFSLCSSTEFDDSVYQSLVRFCSHLDGLRSQMAYHISSVEAELRLCVHSPMFASTSPQPGSTVSGNGSRPSSRGSGSSDGIPLEDLGERLERLRATGWRRPRFNPRQYEVLRERVLEELAVA